MFMRACIYENHINIHISMKPEEGISTGTGVTIGREIPGKC